MLPLRLEPCCVSQVCGAQGVANLVWSCGTLPGTGIQVEHDAVKSICDSKAVVQRVIGRCCRAERRAVVRMANGSNAFEQPVLLAVVEEDSCAGRPVVVFHFLLLLVVVVGGDVGPCLRAAAAIAGDLVFSFRACCLKVSWASGSFPAESMQAGSKRCCP